MEQFEYDSIMDRFTEEFNVELDSYTRKSLVLFHQRMSTIRELSFESLCKQMILEEKCNRIHPGMDIYNRVFTIHGQN